MTHDDRENRKTDPITHEPPSAPAASPLLAMPPAARVPEEAKQSAETWPGYDESNFMHRATAAVIDGTNALLNARHTHDIETIMQRQRALFQEAIVPKLDRLASRVDRHDRRLDSGGERIEHLSLELAALRTQVAELDQLYARMDQLEHELALLKNGPDAAGTAETKAE
jgi:hypothetical protein